MRVFNSTVMVLLAIAVGLFVCVARYAKYVKERYNISYSELLIGMIKRAEYVKAVLPNDYPDYPGELEDKDTEEFISYLKSGILKKTQSASSKRQSDSL